MGCTGSHQKKNQSQMEFTADLHKLSNIYYKAIIHARNTDFFKERNQRLEKAVQLYLRQFPNFDKSDMDLMCVDTTHKLHPKDYATDKVDKEYLIAACLRQESFIRGLHVNCITYESCRTKYIKFLRVVQQRMDTITVPDLAQDFMWHSHMQDNEKYKFDTTKLLGTVLNHDDEIPDDKLKKYWDEAYDKRQNQYNNKYTDKQQKCSKDAGQGLEEISNTKRETAVMAS